MNDQSEIGPLRSVELFAEPLPLNEKFVKFASVPVGTVLYDCVCIVLTFICPKLMVVVLPATLAVPEPEKLIEPVIGIA